MGIRGIHTMTEEPIGTYFLIKESNDGHMNTFSASDYLDDLFKTYEALFILAEADPTFAKAQQDMTIYYD